MVFTGHYHAHDIVQKTTDNNNTIYDIETGSLVTYPCPYRTMTLTNQGELQIKGSRIENIDYDTGDKTFQEYAENYIQTGLPLLVKSMLMMEPYNLDETTATMLEPAITESFIAHYEGDESNPSETTQAIISTLKMSSDPTIGLALEAIWNDPEPTDWEVNLQLQQPTVSQINNAPNFSVCVIYPNPTSNTVSIETTNRINQIDEVEMLDISGNRLLLKKNINAYNTTLNVSNLKQGVYIIRISSKEADVFKKLTKQ